MDWYWYAIIGLIVVMAGFIGFICVMVNGALGEGKDVVEEGIKEMDK